MFGLQLEGYLVGDGWVGRRDGEVGLRDCIASIRATPAHQDHGEGHGGNDEAVSRVGVMLAFFNSCGADARRATAGEWGRGSDVPDKPKRSGIRISFDVVAGSLDFGREIELWNASVSCLLSSLLCSSVQG